MVTLVWSPLRRWWMTAFEAPGAAAVMPVAFRRPAVRAERLVSRLPRQEAKPVTPFKSAPVAAGSVGAAQLAARRFWMTLDPQDRRRAAIGGSFAEVCAALESLAAVEERGG